MGEGDRDASVLGEAALDVLHVPDPTGAEHDEHEAGQQQQQQDQQRQEQHVAQPRRRDGARDDLRPAAG